MRCLIAGTISSTSIDKRNIGKIINAIKSLQKLLHRDNCHVCFPPFIKPSLRPLACADRVLRQGAQKQAQVRFPVNYTMSFPANQVFFSVNPIIERLTPSVCLSAATSL